jgi:hypothetical protein
MLSVVYAKYCSAECSYVNCHNQADYAECRYAEYRYANCRGAFKLEINENFIFLNLTMIKLITCQVFQ